MGSNSKNHKGNGNESIMYENFLKIEDLDKFMDRVAILPKPN